MREITFRDIKELARSIENPPYNLTPEQLWSAYKKLNKSKVKDNPVKTLTDLISIVRFSTGNQDMLVPNSELISGRVTNWVLHNPYGRLRIRVGVAYGSDINKVKEILESVSHKNNNVITDGRVSEPKALFMGFGDSSLEFELRVRIFDIKKRYDVASELYFKIDEEFQKNKIS